MSWKDIPIPSRLAKRPTDKRGFPVPAIALVDSDGRPHFTITDEVERQAVIVYSQCALCGQRLGELRWFVGGPMSAFHETGAYLDPAMHGECLKYAMQVCPYLAMPRYTKLIGDKTIDYAKIKGDIREDDPSVIDDRPPLFVAVGALRQINIMEDAWVKYVKPSMIRSVHYWKHSVKLEREVGEAMVREHYPELAIIRGR